MVTEDSRPVPTDRRTFLKATGAAALAIGMPLPLPAAAAANVRFGVDMFSVAAQNWTPFQMLDWAAKMNVKVVHFSEIRFLGSPTGRLPLRQTTCARSARGPMS